MKQAKMEGGASRKGGAIGSALMALGAAVLAMVPMTQAQALGPVVTIPGTGTKSYNVVRYVTATAEGHQAAKNKAYGLMRCSAPTSGKPFNITNQGYVRNRFGQWDFIYTYKFSYMCKVVG